MNVNGRTMAVDSTGSTAYLLTTSGLSIAPLGTTQQIQLQPGAALPSTMMLVNPNGVVNAANYQASIVLVQIGPAHRKRLKCRFVHQHELGRFDVGEDHDVGVS